MGKRISKVCQYQKAYRTNNPTTNNKMEYRKPFKQTMKLKEVAPSKVRVLTQEEINEQYNQ